MQWVQLPESCDVMNLHRRALAVGVNIAPRPVFSAQRRYRKVVALAPQRAVINPYTSTAIASVSRMAPIAVTVLPMEA
jgi:hypothetical protein